MHAELKQIIVPENKVDADVLKSAEVEPIIITTTKGDAVFAFTRTRHTFGVFSRWREAEVHYPAGFRNYRTGRLSVVDNVVIIEHGTVNYDSGSIRVEDFEIYKVPMSNHGERVEVGPLPPSIEADTYVDSLTPDLHELADEHDWCSEFDKVLEEAGLETRERDYSSRISARVTVSMSDTSASTDEEIAGVLGDADRISLSSFEISMTVDVNVNWTGRYDQDDQIDRSDVDNALDDVLSVPFDLNEWEVLDTEAI